MNFGISSKSLKSELNALGDRKTAEHSQRFFKTGPGQYGEGDVFIGVRVPVTRRICKPYADLGVDQLELLLESDVHEHRLAAAMLMEGQAKRARRVSDQRLRKSLYDLYLRRTDRINNWDIVDCSAREVVGQYLLDHNNVVPLRKLAKSPQLWERRIAIVAAWAWTKVGDFGPVFEIAEMLLTDDEDLIHKATGWMLREAGKMDERALTSFLAEHATQMPRTALRYSIERLSPEQRRHWMTQ